MFVGVCPIYGQSKFTILQHVHIFCNSIFEPLSNLWQTLNSLAHTLCIWSIFAKHRGGGASRTAATVTLGLSDCPVDNFVMVSSWHEALGSLWVRDLDTLGHWISSCDLNCICRAGHRPSYDKSNCQAPSALPTPIVWHRTPLKMDQIHRCICTKSLDETRTNLHW